MFRMDFTMNGLSPNEWEEEDYNLSEFMRKFSFPQVVRFTKGQCMSEGVPSLSNQYLSQMALLTQVAKSYKVAAQCVKFRDRKRVIRIGHKLSIPETYEGWFEILSEDGRAVKCIENAGDLLMTPCNMFLVRENIKAHLAEKENQTLISDKTRIVREGETLVIAGELFVTPDKCKYGGHYLRCFTTKGEPLFLNVYQKGKFSVIGGEDGISGVHTIKQLISSKRFPLMVRLVYGKPPDGLKIGSEFTAEMRLYCLYKEESIMALPLLNISELVALPPSERLKVQVPSDPEKLMQSQIFRILVEKSNTLYQESCNKIKIFDFSLYKQLCKTSVPDPKSKYGDHIVDTEKQANDSEDKSNGMEYNYDEIDEIYNYVRGRGLSPQNEIKRNRSSTASSSPLNTNSSPISCSSDKPEPPPIETIPVRRFAKEDNQILPPENGVSSIIYGDFEMVKGHVYQIILPKKNFLKKNSESSITSQGKHFISNSGSHGVNKFSMPSPAESRIHQKSRILNHSPTSQDEAIENQRDIRRKSTASAPIFNIRYKSLHDLSIDADSSENRSSRFSGDNWRMMQRHYSAASVFGVRQSRDGLDITHESENRFHPGNGNGKLFKRNCERDHTDPILDNRGIKCQGMKFMCKCTILSLDCQKDEQKN